MPPVDVHAHCVPEAVLDQLDRHGERFGMTLVGEGGRRFAVVGGARTGGIRPEFVDVGARLRAMDQAGVQVQILSNWMDMSAANLTGAAASRYARMFNEALVGVVQGHPSRFAALANVPLRDPVAAAAELRHSVLRLGMLGAEIGSRPGGRELDDPGLEPFWRAAEELPCLLLVHPHDALAGRQVSRHFLNNLVGNPAETTIAAGHLIFGGVLERYPSLRICLVHGGGFAPYQMGRWDHAFATDARGAAANLTRPPSEWLRSMLFDSVVHSSTSLSFLMAAVGATQVVLGSDYPFEMGEPAPVSRVRGVPEISDHEVRLILSGNIEKAVELPELSRPAAARNPRRRS